MQLLRSLTGKGLNDEERRSRSVGASDNRLQPRPTALYKTATGLGRRRLDGPFPGQDLRDTVLVSCLLAGYTDARTRQVYSEVVDGRMAISGVAPLTNPGETANHAYQRAQTQRITAYKDIVLHGDPVKHRLQADEEYFEILKDDFDHGYPGLFQEIEHWRYTWQDIAQTLVSDSDAEKQAGNPDKAAAMDAQAKLIKDGLGRITDEQMYHKILDALKRRAKIQQSLKLFEEEAAERRGRIAQNRGARREAGYKNPTHVIKQAERDRSLKASRSMATLAASSIKDFGAKP